jgi:hypothetical protein
MLTALYLGALPAPPSTTATGGPLTVGAIYYDTTAHQPYVWTGTAWESFYSPQKAATASLYYVANANQSTFPITTPDIIGNTGNLVNGEGVMVYLNGVRLTANSDYTVNSVASSVTLVRPQPAGALVGVDVLTPASQLAPGAVLAVKLTPLVFDGVTTQFAMLVLSSGLNAPVQAAEHIVVSVDGVVQEPGAQYTVSAPNTITFAQAPGADAHGFMVWLQPGRATALAEPLIVPAAWRAGVTPNGVTVFIADRALNITDIVGVVETANGAAATVSVVKAANNQALSAGTVIHSGSFNANGTAGMNQTLTLTMTTMNAGDRLGLTSTGTFTASVGSISVMVQ